MQSAIQIKSDKKLLYLH